MEGPASTRAPLWRQLLFLLVPAAAAFAVYANTLDAGFVYDDSAQIVHNPWVNELRHFPKAVTRPVWAFHTNLPTNYFRPFQMGAYNLMWNASGGSPLVFHLVNVLFHVVATSAVAGIVRRASDSRVLAFGAALLFAVHPLSTETVAWIACLPELGYSAFGLGALLLHMQAWDAGPRRRRWLRAAELAAFALALFSKETAATLVALVFLLEAWVRPARAGGWRLASIRACVPYAVVVGLYAVLRLVAVGGVAPLSRPNLTAWDALLNAPWLLLSYVGKMVWPASLVAYHVFDPLASAAEPAFYLALPAVAAIAAAVVWTARYRGDLAFAGALMLLPLLPVLYVPAVGLNAFAERYAYLPTAGFAWLVAAAVGWIATRAAAERAGVATVVACVALAIPAAARTAVRNRAWHDDEALASTTIRQTPRARVMWGLLAGTQRTSGRPDEALATLHEALGQFPGDPLIRSEIVSLELTTRAIAPEDAIRRLEGILREGLIVYEMHVYLGRARSLAGDHAEAERAYRDAIEMNPSSKPAYDGLALALISQGKSGVDLTDLRTRAGFSLGGELDLLIDGAAHLTAGRLDQAERAFNEVLTTFPDSSGALLSLAVVSAKRSDHELAVEFCRRAIAARPDLADAYQQLGVSLMDLGRHDQAVEALEAAAGIAPHDKEVHNRLGVAFARAGRLDDARRAWNRALEIDPDFEGARFNMERLDSQ